MKLTRWKMKMTPHVRPVFWLRLTVLQELKLRIDFLGQSVSWFSSSITMGPQKSQASINAGLCLWMYWSKSLIIKRTGQWRLISWGTASLKLCISSGAFLSYFNFIFVCKLLPHFRGSTSKFWACFSVKSVNCRCMLKTQFLLSNTALCAISAHLTEFHCVRVYRVGVSWFPADQSSLGTACTLPLLDHWRRWH